VIHRASELIDKGNKNFDAVLGKLEAARQEIEEERLKLEAVKKEYAEKLEKAEREAKRILADAERRAKDSQAKATAMLESARATSEFVIAELDKARRSQGKNLDETKQGVRRAIKESDDFVNPVVDTREKGYVLPRPLKAGDEVIIMTLDRRGTLIGDPDAKGNVTVKTGLINTKTNVKNLKLCEDAETTAKTVAKTVAKGASLAKDFKIEIDLRGMTGEEAWAAVDRYLDNAILVGMHSVRLIHGKGTGALRAALWNYLKRDRRVASFRIGRFGEGDGGVTIVELK
jgi:DNA mismatch repair protein MutS2